ncbi:hypothetical protein OUZ56_002843 [Daphnia magna]|uniref:Uncharacterized protein n=1 Tax=Daphnia magna TaxID=35525 RepID=A0ABR0A6Y6_9CRUS|nr:hypothetical protein OUZ56_002843 [Daphnia magna]
MTDVNSKRRKHSILGLELYLTFHNWEGWVGVPSSSSPTPKTPISRSRPTKDAMLGGGMFVSVDKTRPEWEENSMVPTGIFGFILERSTVMHTWVFSFRALLLLKNSINKSVQECFYEIRMPDLSGLFDETHLSLLTDFVRAGSESRQTI